jgi:hypothetical protein
MNDLHQVLQSQLTQYLWVVSIYLACSVKHLLLRCVGRSLTIWNQLTPCFAKYIMLGWSDGYGQHLASLFSHQARKPLLYQVMRMQPGTAQRLA